MEKKDRYNGVDRLDAPEIAREAFWLPTLSTPSIHLFRSRAAQECLAPRRNGIALLSDAMRPYDHSPCFARSLVGHLRPRGRYISTSPLSLSTPSTPSNFPITKPTKNLCQIKK